MSSVLQWLSRLRWLMPEARDQMLLRGLKT